MKVGIVVTAHCSKEYRPNGNELISEFISSAKSSTIYPMKLYVFDNSSTEPIPIKQANFIKLIRVEDQTIRGLSGTWNDGIIFAIEDDCDIIIVSNDDVILSSQINSFVDEINNHPHKDISLFGPVSNGILAGSQKAKGPINKTIELTGNNSNMLNGFMFSFTKEFYDKFKMEDGKMIDEVNYPWGGNEEELQKRVWSQGARSFILGNYYFTHKKIRGWKKIQAVKK